MIIFTTDIGSQHYMANDHAVYEFKSDNSDNNDPVCIPHDKVEENISFAIMHSVLKLGGSIENGQIQYANLGVIA